jgi:iron complex transport system ATP-binding protein
MFLSVDGIDCSYNSTQVLKDVRLQVGRGDFVGIIGPNGSGKTTLLKAISATLKPAKGAILLEDVDVHSIKKLDLAKKMAVVPQETSILFDFTAFDIVMMGRNPHVDRFRFETSKDVAAVKKAMKLAGCLEFAQREVGSLSAGERQRVAIARAIAQEPSVMLLDEPTSHLDINFQLETMALLRDLSDNAKLTVIAVFHDLNLAARYCRTLIILKDGKILAAGNCADVFTKENIKKAYGVDVDVRYHPLTQSPYIIPLRPSGSDTNILNGRPKALAEG